MKRIIYFSLLVFLLPSCFSRKVLVKDTVRYEAPASKGNISIEGGDGSSFEEAIIILGASGSSEGVPVEYWYLEKIYGTKGVDWIFEKQALVFRGDKKYDILSIKLPKQHKKTDVYFDITDFFGKKSGK